MSPRLKSKPNLVLPAKPLLSSTSCPGLDVLFHVTHMKPQLVEIYKERNSIRQIGGHVPKCSYPKKPSNGLLKLAEADKGNDHQNCGTVFTQDISP